MASALAWLLPVACSAAAMVVAGSVLPLGYDEEWHRFIAEVEPWPHPLREALYDTHPPLGYLMLRPFTAPGDGPLWVRLPTILCALGCLPVLQVLLRGFGVGRWHAALAVAILGCSQQFTTIGVYVRSYAPAMLSLAFALMAAAALLRDRDTRRRRSWWMLGAATAAGVNVLYACALPLLPIWAALLLRLRRDRSFRSTHRRDALAGGAVAAAGAAAVFAWMCLSSASPADGHLSAIMPAPGEGLWHYFDRGCSMLLANCFGLDPAPPLTGALALLLAAVFAHTWWRCRGGGAGIVLGALLFTFVAHFVLALGHVYPFGGLARHQAMLLVPGWTLLALTLLRLPRTPRIVALVIWPALAAYLAITGWTAWPQRNPDEFLSEPLWRRQTLQLRERIAAGGGAEPVLFLSRIDKFGCYATARDDGGWTMTGKLLTGDGHRIWTFDAAFAGRPLRILHDLDLWTTPVDADPLFALRLADLMQKTAVPRLWVFAMQGGPSQFRLDDDGIRGWSAAFAAAGLRLVQHQTLDDGWLYELAR